MKYEDVLRKWGTLKLGTYNDLSRFQEVINVSVDMDFDEGYNCCNGSDPDCYCSFAESPSCNIVVSGIGVKENERDVNLQYTMSSSEFDFATMVKELFELSETK